MSSKKQFNIFEVAKIWKAEELHTSIIAELINPQSEFHDHGQAFLDLFLQVIGLNKDDFIGAPIATEEPTMGGRRIDMVIWSNTHCIPFEVKIWAKDQQNQLSDYYDFAITTGKKVPFIVYLTPTERKPSDDSKGSLQDSDIKCITFEKQILPWLKQCMDCKPAPDVLEILNQLHHNIEKNIVRNYEHPLLTTICENKVLLNLAANKTECTPKYRTYTLEKQGALEVALRIELKNDDYVNLIIICGVEYENGRLDYRDARKKISEAPDKFTQLLNDAFQENFKGIDKNPKHTKWARLQRPFCRNDGEDDDSFAKRCCDGITEILKNCKNIETE